ncbi:hypothetical protein HY988_07090 [Candidatus Micrarchaeota archaeon]|nr:hypothetical protein [Candidatus Micrarchaeota archaeon]
MKGYTMAVPENCACARLEGVNASYKDLSEVCGRIQGKKSAWAMQFLELASNQEIPIMFKRHNKKLGHRRELGGQKGRYPHKAATFVLNALKSAIANGGVKGLGVEYTILSACANKTQALPRMASKGRSARSYLELSKIEVVLKPDEIPNKVEVTKPAKKTEDKKTEPSKQTEPSKPKPDTSKHETPKPQNTSSAAVATSITHNAGQNAAHNAGAAPVKKEEKKPEAKKETAKPPEHQSHEHKSHEHKTGEKHSDHKKGDS